jgi:hypothetical protein
MLTSARQEKSMSESKTVAANVYELATAPTELALETQAKLVSASIDQVRMMQTYWTGLSRYFLDFMAPAFSALEAFTKVELEKLEEHSPEETIRDHMGLWLFNLRLAEKGLTHGMKAIQDFHAHQLEQAFHAWHNTLNQQKGEDIAAFMARQARLMDLVVHEYPQAIRDIEPDYGFHFDDGNYIKTAETDRFYLYQVLPWDKSGKKGNPSSLFPPMCWGPTSCPSCPLKAKVSFTASPIRVFPPIFASSRISIPTPRSRR